MLKFKRTTITINGEATTGYSVEGLSRCFRGLQVAVVKDGDRWYAHEATTGMDLTPRSWAGGLSNKTRAGIIQIVAIHLQNTPMAMWKKAQEQVNYDLEIDAEFRIASGIIEVNENHIAAGNRKNFADNNPVKSAIEAYTGFEVQLGHCYVEPPYDPAREYNGDYFRNVAYQIGKNLSWWMSDFYGGTKPMKPIKLNVDNIIRKIEISQ